MRGTEGVKIEFASEANCKFKGVGGQRGVCKGNAVGYEGYEGDEGVQRLALQRAVRPGQELYIKPINQSTSFSSRQPHTLRG